MRRLGITAPTMVLGLLCLMYMILYIDRVNIATAAPAMRADLGLNNTELGFAISAFAYPYTLFQLFGGWIGRRFGARRTLCAAILVVCIATALTGAVAGLVSLFAVRILLGLGEGAALPTATHAMTSWAPSARWGFAQGITHSFARFGNFATPPIVAALILWSSWRAAFFVLAAMSLAWLAVWAWYFRDTPDAHAGVTEADLAKLPQRPTQNEMRSVPFLPLLRRMFPATLVNFCYGWTLWFFLSWTPSFFIQSYHLALAGSAFYSAITFLGGFFGDTAGGLMSDFILKRTGHVAIARRGVIVLGFVGAGLSLIPVIAVHDLAIATASLASAFFFAEMIVAPIWAVPMDITPRYAGWAAGMMNFGSAFAGIVSPPLFGSMLDMTGSWELPFLALTAMLAAGAALAFWLSPDRPFEEEGVLSAPLSVARASTSSA
jgi:MFS family permease